MAKFKVSFRPYPAGAGSSVHDELHELEGHCIECALDAFYRRKDFNPEWRVINIWAAQEDKA